MSQGGLVVLLLLMAGCKTTPNAASLSTDFAETTPLQPYAKLVQSEDPLLRRNLNATVLLVPASSLIPQGDNWRLNTKTGAEELNLCPSHLFAHAQMITIDTSINYDQQYNDVCSGVLIHPQAVLTAGHCLQSANSCNGLKLVFGYVDESEASMVRPESAIYSCTRIERQGNLRDGDYALVRLDRPVVGVEPVPFEYEPGVSGHNMLAVGYPLGAPLHGSFNELAPQFDDKAIEVRTDIFKGMSGGPLFELSSGKLMGVLSKSTAGEDDHIETDEGCYIDRIVNQGEDEAMRYSATNSMNLYPYFRREKPVIDLESVGFDQAFGKDGVLTVVLRNQGQRTATGVELNFFYNQAQGNCYKSQDRPLKVFLGDLQPDATDQQEFKLSYEPGLGSCFSLSGYFTISYTDNNEQQSTNLSFFLPKDALR